MIYLEHTPAAPLNRCIRSLWYARVHGEPHSRERILPTGRVQVILNLARDFLLDCPEGQSDQAMSPSLIIGARSTYEIVDTSDMAELIGIVFHPGGFASFAPDAPTSPTSSAPSPALTRRHTRRGAPCGPIMCRLFSRIADFSKNSAPPGGILIS